MAATVARAESRTTDCTVLHNFLRFALGAYPHSSF